LGDGRRCALRLQKCKCEMAIRAQYSGVAPRNYYRTHLNRRGVHDRSGVEAQEIEQIAPTRRGWASECCGVMRSATCIILPEVILLALVSGLDTRKERTILTYLDKSWFLTCCLDRGEKSKS
jgi:hypothetical protein